MTPEQTKEYKDNIDRLFAQIAATTKEFGLTDLEGSNIFVSELEKLVEGFRSKAKELKSGIIKPTSI